MENANNNVIIYHTLCTVIYRFSQVILNVGSHMRHTHFATTATAGPHLRSLIYTHIIAYSGTHAARPRQIQTNFFDTQINILLANFLASRLCVPPSILDSEQ